MSEKFYDNVNAIKAPDTKPGEIGEVFVMVRDAQPRDGRNGKYIAFNGFDSTGAITAKKWDCTDEDISAICNGAKLKLKVTIEDYKGSKTLRVNKYGPITDEDNVAEAHFVAKAPVPKDEMMKYIEQMVDGISDKDLRDLVKKILSLAAVKKNLHYPGGVNAHHTEENGLLYHIYRILKNIESYATKNVYNLNIDLLVTTAVLHDIGKIREIEIDEITKVPIGLTLEGSALGHILIAVELIGATGNFLKTPKEKIMLIKHMIAASHGEPEHGAMRRPIFPEAEMFYYMDQTDTRMTMYEQVIAATEKGELSEWDAVLRRRIYNIPDFVNEVEEELSNEKPKNAEPSDDPQDTN